MPPLWPTVNASLNLVSALLLAAGWWAVRGGRKSLHGRLLAAAVSVSAVFLASYLLYHAGNEPTRFSGTGLIRPVYFAVLISHTVLAAAIIPLVLRMLYLARRRRWPSHRALGRLALPLWLYVSVTGVAVYGMLYLF